MSQRLKVKIKTLKVFQPKWCMIANTIWKPIRS